MSRKSSSVTISDVAREAGVSPATVSRFINNTAPVSPATRQRIQAVMRALEYVPSAAAPQLATQKTYVIGLLVTDISAGFFSPLVGAIEPVVRQEGYSLLLASRRAGRQGDEQIPLGPHNSDGLIVFAGSLNDDELLELYQADFPLRLSSGVLADVLVEGSGWLNIESALAKGGHVTADNRAKVRGKVAEFLKKLFLLSLMSF